ncbi:hypothetical protein ACHAWF_011003 [Thalassiosira exigua]
MRVLSALVALTAVGCASELLDDGSYERNGEAVVATDASANRGAADRPMPMSNAVPDSDSGDGNDSTERSKRQRVTLLGLEDIIDLERSGIVGLGNDFNHNANDDGSGIPPRLNYNQLHADDMVEDSLYDPFSPDPSCMEANDQGGDGDGGDCWHPPDSTMEEELVEVCDDEAMSKSAGLETLAWGYGGVDPDDGMEEEQEGQELKECDDPEGGSDGETEEGDGGQNSQCRKPSTEKCGASKTKFIDKHWGGDLDVLRLRDSLRGKRGKYWDVIEQDFGADGTESNSSKHDEEYLKQQSPPKRKQRQSERPPRPPVFLLPGLASTRLVSWKLKKCMQSPLLSDIKMLDYVWLNMNLLIQMATIDARCWNECMTLGRYQSDYDDDSGDEIEKDDGDVDKGNVGEKEERSHGCKLRPDEGLDSISSLAPGSISSNLFVGGSNTVYSWLIQWLADNLGYDVTSMVALPYDWRLSPDKMESRDGFLTLMRKKIEAAVQSNGRPGIMVAHSMGNSWLRAQMREETYARYVQQADHHAATRTSARADGRGPFWRGRALYRGLMNSRGSARVKDVAEEDVSSEEVVLDELAWELGQDDTELPNKKGEGRGDDERMRKYPKLYEIAKIEGDTEWIEWLGKHIWTYVGLSAPLLGAVGPLRSVLSGENMGLPFTHEEARGLELSFGSTSTANPISTKMGFCDGDGMGAKHEERRKRTGTKETNKLACLEELVSGIESSKGKADPWEEFPALRLLLKDRVDFDTIVPTVRVEREFCSENEDSPCTNQTIDFGPEDVMDGTIFHAFSQIWKERNDPLGVKLDQLRQAWWHTKNVHNMLESTPERPHIKHVIMAYGTDVPTEVGKKDLVSNATNSATPIRTEADEPDVVPSLSETVWEEPRDTFLRKKKQRRRTVKTKDNKTPVWLHHSGDGTIPYISLMWAHTWLLHATRAMRSLKNTTSMLEGERISNPNNVLDSIKVSHRPKGGIEWEEGYGPDPQNDEDLDPPSDDDTGTSHPHGTKYKPKMVRFQSSGKSRSTGMEYTTTVIEAIGVEHKETTRNYDILAAAFTDVLKNMHDDFGLI